MKCLILSLLVAIFVLSGCTCSVAPVTEDKVEVFDSQDTSSLVINFSNQMEDKYRIILEDSRIVYDKYNIKKIYLQYSSQQLLTFCEARLLIVEVVEEFLYRLNNHTALSFQIGNFPFSADDLQVGINFESFHGFYVDPLYMGRICLKKGCVYFYAFDIKNLYADWSHQRFEPYSKSRELALIKKEADIPFEDRYNPPKRPNEYLYDRYIPR